MADSRHRALTRRSFLAACPAVAAVFRAHPAGAESNGSPPRALPADVTIIEFSESGHRQEKARVPKIVRTDAEWRHMLSAEAFEVTRHSATERPFTGRYWNLHDKGLYRCVCCGTALFASETKYDSHTGWPSFWEPIAKENIETAEDRSFGMVRTSVSCRRCDAHLGHVFDDGPPPTGLRYCMNAAALWFVKLG